MSLPHSNLIKIVCINHVMCARRGARRNGFKSLACVYQDEHISSKHNHVKDDNFMPARWGKRGRGVGERERAGGTMETMHVCLRCHEIEFSCDKFQFESLSRARHLDSIDNILFTKKWDVHIMRANERENSRRRKLQKLHFEFFHIIFPLPLALCFPLQYVKQIKKPCYFWSLISFHTNEHFLCAERVNTASSTKRERERGVKNVYLVSGMFWGIHTYDVAAFIKLACQPACLPASHPIKLIGIGRHVGGEVCKPKQVVHWAGCSN
jgi:hypothetical protein